MAKKKKAESEPVPATALETKPVRLDLPEDVHRLLRKVAAEHNRSMASHARDIVARVLREEAKELGIK